MRHRSVDATQTLCGSWLACNADASVHPGYRGHAIAGEPAPTLRCAVFRLLLRDAVTIKRRLLLQRSNHAFAAQRLLGT
ncbi:hypothetical protein CQ048_21000 [Pseudomonas trivialis]|nr:hypothetical protein CQ048_21000 [Pseudomonas trivialis]PRB23399.1 hypothetical protein CQ041_20835 [Pseudomonas sp. MYb60]